ncbi:MAG TPA: M13 family metallopeptidase [Candidatus Saccharimonadia bacterium]|nr:M13 family metallopeptidase [Candidatus Saccharimonadia bacterium]
MFPTRRLALAALLIVTLAACRDEVAAPPSTAEVAPAPVATVEEAAARNGPELGSFGIDTAGMDTTVKPGDDFHAYANGNWVRNTPIPADRSRYSMFTLLTEKALARTRVIVEDAAARDAATGAERKVGDYYVAFMDQAGIEAKGLASLKPELDEIAGIADRMRLAVLLGGSLRADVDLLNSTDYYTDRLFGLWVSQHLDRPAEVAPYLVQGGLGLPDRDFYLEGGRYEAIRQQYAAYIAQLLSLAGSADAEAKAARIVALETAIARVHATQLETNDVKRGANYWKREEFATRAPGLDWNAFFEAAGLSSQPEFIVWQPGAVTGIASLVGSEPLATWQDYLAFHAIDRAAPYLPKAFVDARFAFRDSVLEGTPQQQERWKRALNSVNDALGEAVGSLYVAKHFTPQTKARADAMVANVIAAFDRRIDKLEWMTPATKARAKAKLARLEVGMGYPATWRDYGALEVRRDDALGNVARAELFEYRRNLAKLGKPVDRGEWYLLPQEVNALNIPLENRLIFPAAILEAPFFDAAADDAVNYGAIGGVIGHEITHSFDSSGALFDETGRLANWWTPEDLTRFEAAGAALAAQYDAYKAFPDLSLNGKLTLGENIADVAGLATAHDAYVLSQEGKPPVVLDGHTADQRFFLGWAQQWRSLYREPALRNAIVTNVHAPGEYRAATVRNLDAWYDAFDVGADAARYLAPEARVKVW